MDDREVEALLRRMPLVRPGNSMDDSVFARRPRRRWPSAMGGGTLAAAATLVLAFTLGWLGWHTAPPAPAPSLIPASDPAFVPGLRMEYGDQLMPAEPVAPLAPSRSVATPGDTTNPSPTRKVRETTTGPYTWTDRDGGIHVEDTTKPHDEEIHIEVPVE